MRVLVVFFFFKQKTSYERRISDWSSDVCSSDLHLARLVLVGRRAAGGREIVEGERGIAGDGEAPRHVADVRVQSAVLVDHQHGRHGRVARGAKDRKSVV